MTESSTDLVVAGIGAVVDLDDATAVAQALSDIRSLEEQLRQAKGELTAAFALQTELRGTKTLHLPSGHTATLSGGTETVWDIPKLDRLRELGLPEDRMDALIKTEVVLKVDAREAKIIAAANPAYAEVIEDAKTVIRKAPYVSIK